MTLSSPSPAPSSTHEVLNQPPPLGDLDLLALDSALQESLVREGAEWALAQTSRYGKLIGSAEMQRAGALANENTPKLHTHDRYGHRIDEVEFHPSWHTLMRAAVEAGIHCGPWRDPRPGAHVARAALMMLSAVNEAGHGCPISMTYSVVPALAREPKLLEEWKPRVASLEYDPRPLPAPQKKGVLFGMAMTEKQGGSDVRANTTRAEPIGARGAGNEYLLTGHKWFCSAPMNDAFLVLAQAEGGLSCFLLPRWTPDGKRNGFQIQRLKDKCGNRSNASSEIELRAAWARMVGEEGRGVHTILEMVNHTRLDCVLGAAGMMRACVMHACHHAGHRSAFGKRLSEQPLMRAVLADMAIESEAATVLSLRLARAYDNPGEAPFRRIATAISKYWVCKRSAPLSAEALECLGGNGVVEEAPLARLYREAPVNSVWEGSGNVICLDVLRAIAKEPQSVAALVDELRLSRGADKRLDLHREALEHDLAGPLEPALARTLVERLALALQGALLVRHSPAAVADGFCATRLGGAWGHTFGSLPKSVEAGAILARAWPALA